VVVVVVVAAARPTPTAGDSDDRLFAIAGQMKCLACAGESVANSQAPLAIEMRGLIRTQMRSGKTDDEILTYFADRYGARVLLTPGASGLSALVWVVPVVVAASAVCGLGLAFARWRRLSTDVDEPSAEDRELVERARRAAP
jgi:cytochrome c-type biogenesis protein CcmH